MEQIQYLLVRESDGFVIGAQMIDDVGPQPETPECPVDGATLVRFDGEFSRAGKRHSQAAYFVDGMVEWLETATLAEAQASAWEAVKQARDAAESADFAFDGGMYQPDKERISGAVLAALLAERAGVEYIEEWTLADDSRRMLTGAQVMALGATLSARVSAIHKTGRELREAIAAATTPQEACACTWPTEEPNAE